MYFPVSNDHTGFLSYLLVVLCDGLFTSLSWFLDSFFFLYGFIRVIYVFYL